MPGTTRYSATFDRTYDEDEGDTTSEPTPATVRRSRSQSLQVESFGDRKQLYSSLNGSSTQGSHSRSSSTEKPATGAEIIPTRTVGKQAVKPHNNPFQFVKVGTCPLYKKAEEQLKKVQEIKKPAVIKEDEEEWQSNLDSWKSRRRKMSESTFRRQEELRRMEMEELFQHEQLQQQQQGKKIKKFSEIVEGRAHRGRALSLCLFSNPLESSEWTFENKRSRRISHDFLHASEESAESSNINSEDDNECFRKQIDELNNKSQSPDGSEHHQNGVQTSTSNSSISKNSDLSELDVSQDGSISHKDHNHHSSGGMYIDSGLESLSSSHRTGEIPDSGSDFSQDSASSISCDSPRVSGIITTGVELLEEFSSNDDELKKQATKSHKEKTPERAVNGTGIHKENGSIEKQSKASEDKKQTKEKIKKAKPPKKPGKASPPKNDQLRKTENSEEKTVKVNSKEVSKGSGRDQKASSGDKGSSNSTLVNGNAGYSLIKEVPVDKVTEEMEKLILQQLEEEEQRAKEIEMNAKSAVGDVDIPLKRVDPPKEKPPPPPMDCDSSPKNSPKGSSVKRTNSTKRILKEINKRRSDFLGIEEPEGVNVNHAGLSMQPPSALENLLKAEQEQAKKLQDALRTASEEDEEIARKEREIIENLEKEERLKMCQNDSSTNVIPPSETEDERIKRLQEERKKNEEEERLIAEEQRMRMEETKLLLQREQQIREQEEAIRKERERLRYEQEVLQREREEHRRKIQMEQEQLKKTLQKAHVPGTPVCQVESPPITNAKPSLPPQLTSSLHHHHPPSHIEAAGQAIPTKAQNGYTKGVAAGSYVQPQPKSSTNQPKQPAATVGSCSRSKNAPDVRSKPKVPLVRKQPEPTSESRYNQNHWLIQEAEMRRIVEQRERQRSQSHNDLRLTGSSHPPAVYNDCHPSASKPVQRPSALPVAQNSTNFAVPMQYSPDKSWNCVPQTHNNNKNAQSRKCVPQSTKHINFDLNQPNLVYSSNFDLSKSTPPAKPSRGALLEKQQEQMLSVSGRKRCSHCGEELGRGAAMIIESLQLYYHIHCFKCCVCHAQLGNGSCGTDVRVRSNKLHCHNCYSNDEAGLKFSQV